MAAGPERLDRVVVRFGERSVALTWSERTELVARLGGFTRARGIVEQFEARGTSAPVVVDASDQGVLLEYLQDWWHEVKTDALPAGIHTLRGELAVELHE